MYSRISGSSNVQYAPLGEGDETRPSATSAEKTDADSQRPADMFAEMHLAAPDSTNGSSSAETPLYSLAPRPPVVKIDKPLFRREAKRFYDDEIKHIAANPQEYSDFISEKAKRTAQVAEKYGCTKDTVRARYFSYQLGKQSVGLLRTEGGFSMTEFEGEKWREQFPERTEITSVVDLQITHPLVENAGDILLEYQLRLDGERPLLNWRAANQGSKARAAKMGFVAVDENNMVLDPTQYPDIWIKNTAGEWQRKNNPPLYLSKAAGGESSNIGSAASPATYSYEDDFM
ncbi:Effector protein NopP [Bradyrhizobium sp. LMTR 3]|uniref:Effector protein NopP n=1 Tax=Bradyrhizobium sp. LMTR 3 TaxID=189873 RepID=UPI000810C918|nr:Effector protein NopP [Bradyrhizobium sp. LMTR 3]OCK59973.1 Effector protein NopP [Bradyrhizobium sp. LMTR 3]